MKKERPQKSPVKKAKVVKSRWKSKISILLVGMAIGFSLYPLTQSQIQTAKPHLNHYYSVGLEKTALILDESLDYLTTFRKTLKKKLTNKKEEIKMNTKKI